MREIGGEWEKSVWTREMLFLCAVGGREAGGSLWGQHRDGPGSLRREAAFRLFVLKAGGVTVQGSDGRGTRATGGEGVMKRVCCETAGRYRASKKKLQQDLLRISVARPGYARPATAKPDDGERRKCGEALSKVGNSRRR